MNTDSENRIMIAELERIIQAEEAKPEAERDQNLIDDCVKEIAEIKGVKAEFSEEEVAQITDSLIQTAEQTKKRKRFVRLAAGIAAAIVLVTGVTACAVNPALINWFKMIVRMPFGAVIEQNTLTYINQGLSKHYNSIYGLIESENLDIYYPSILPDQVKTEYIESFNEGKILSFSFSDNTLHYTIQKDYIEVRQDKAIISCIETSELHFDVYKEDLNYIARAEIEGMLYIIESHDINDLILIVGGLKNEKP